MQLSSHSHKGNHSNAIETTSPETESVAEGKLSVVDNRPEAKALSEMRAMVQKSSRTKVQTFDKESTSLNTDAIHKAAETGIQGTAHPLPHLDKIQKSFGKHDVTHAKTFTGTKATAACDAIGAEAYASGNSIAFRQNTASLHTAAHEAAHIVQQQSGVHLTGGVGVAGDRYEQHADEVAGKVVRGESAESILDNFSMGDSQPPPNEDTVQSERLSSDEISADNMMPHSRYLPGRTPVQMLNSQMLGPPTELPSGNILNVTYAGYAAPVLVGNAINACASATITTAGEKLVTGKLASQPTSPDHMDHYNNANNEWEKVGGLVRDLAANQSATRMHALNHRLDPAKLNNPALAKANHNIFLGTGISNKPNHKNKVEMTVQNALDRAPANNVPEYENEMKNNVTALTFDKATNQPVLYWSGTTKANAGKKKGGIDNDAVLRARVSACVADKTNYPAGISFGAPLGGVNDENGFALTLDESTAINNYSHTWLTYTVTPNYQGCPAYIHSNIQYETDNLHKSFAALKAQEISKALSNVPGALAEVLLSTVLPLPLSDAAFVLSDAAANAPANAATMVVAMGRRASSALINLLSANEEAAILDALVATGVAGDLAFARGLIGDMPNANHVADVIDAMAGIHAGRTAQLLDSLTAPAGGVAAVAAMVNILPQATSNAIAAAWPGGGLAMVPAPIAAVLATNPALPNVAPAGPAGALPRFNPANEAAILTDMNAAQRPAAYLQYPLADAIAIAMALGAPVRNQLFGSMPFNHAAQILGTMIMGAGGQPAAAANTLVALGEHAAARVVEFFTLAEASVFVVALDNVNHASAGIFLQSLSSNKAADIIDDIFTNHGAAVASLFWQHITPFAAAFIAHDLPTGTVAPIAELVANAGGINSPRHTALFLSALNLHTRAADILAAIRVIDPVSAASVVNAITLSVDLGGIFELLTIADARAILRNLPAARAAYLLEVLPTNKAQFFAQFIADLIAQGGAHLGRAAAIVIQLANTSILTLNGGFVLLRAVDIVPLLQAIFAIAPVHVANVLRRLPTDNATHIIDFIRNANAGTAAQILASMHPMDATNIIARLTNASRGPIQANWPGGVIPAAVAFVLAGAAPAALPAGGVPPGALPNVVPGALPGVAVAAPGALPAALPVVAPAGPLAVAGPAAAAALGVDMPTTIDNAIMNTVPQPALNRALGTLTPAKATLLANDVNLAGTNAAFRIEKLASFITWAKHALPTTFTAEVHYYTASYKPGNMYYKYTEKETYSTDL